MKIVGIVGINSRKSYNRMLLKFMKANIIKDHDFQIDNIDQVPMFYEDFKGDLPILPQGVQDLAEDIEAADAVIIACPEYNHSVPSALKSVTEWLSYTIHPLKDKPVMIVGASTQPTGSSRAQVHLRAILNSPGIHALVWQGNEFLIGNATQAFDDAGNIKDPAKVLFLQECFDEFINFVNRFNGKPVKKDIDE